jgi:competence protein ComEC
MLIDAGPLSNKAGQRAVAPYLKAIGVNTIDFMVSSHPHPDHYGGLLAVLDQFQVKEFWHNGRVNEGAKQVLNKAIEKNATVKTLKRGDVIEGEDYTITVLHPLTQSLTESTRGEYANENNDSLVFTLEIMGVKFLFTGDIDEEAINELLYLAQWLKSDVIKVPHHGGKIVNAAAFVQVVNPKIVVVSVGADNPYNHPHHETLQVYFHARLFRTDKDGATAFYIDNGRCQALTYQDFQLKKVKTRLDEIDNLKRLTN